MKTHDEFAIFAKGVMRESCVPLENKRKLISGRIFFLFGILILFGFLSIVSILAGSTIFFLGFMLIGFVACLCQYLFRIKPFFDEYKLAYKKLVIGEIVKFVEPSLSYQPASGIAQSKYMMSGIFTTIPDRYSSEDYISGKIDKTEIEFSEVHSQYKTEHTDSKGHKRTQWHTIFRGMFVISDFNKEFQGRTVILPDFAEKFLGFIGQTLQSWNMSRDQLIKLEDPDFEKLFVVYGTDQVEARYILSPALMRKIIDFHEKAKKLCRGDISLSFVGSKLFLAISCNRDLFEPRIFSPVCDNKTLAEYFSFINVSAGIVEELSLNTRIWSKK